MIYLLVDDEPIILEGMEWTLREIIGEDGQIYTAPDPFAAIEIAKEHKIDIMFTDVDMPGMNGLKLAGEIHAISEDTDIVFATGYAHYSLDAWKTVAKAFILKPVGEQDMRSALEKIWKQRKLLEVAEEKAKTPVVISDEDKLNIMCFGNFEVTFHNKNVHFARKKSKEMLAYLVDRRGAMITTDELRSVLWEEEDDSDEKKGYVRVLANDIRKSMDALGLEQLLINNQNSYGLDLARIKCDYFDFLDGDEKAKKSFQEEYMVQYSWAEVTLGRLLNLV